MTNEIKKPAQITYYILQNGTIVYGWVEPNQQMNSGLSNIETFLDKQQWIDRLLALGIARDELINEGIIIE